MYAVSVFVPESPDAFRREIPVEGRAKAAGKPLGPGVDPVAASAGSVLTDNRLVLLQERRR